MFRRRIYKLPILAQLTALRATAWLVLCQKNLSLLLFYLCLIQCLRCIWAFFGRWFTTSGRWNCCNCIPETWALTFSRNGRPGVVGCWSHSTTCRGEQTKSGKATVNYLTIPILCQLVQNFAHQQYLTDIPHIDTTILSCNLIRLYCYIIYATCHIHPHRFVKRKIWIS